MDFVLDLNKFGERAEEIDLSNAETLKEANETVQKLKDLLVKNENLTCLAAPHLGINKRIFCINFAGDIRTFINPLIQKCEGLTMSREKDVCIPGKEYIVPRNEVIVAAYQTPTGKIESNKFEGMASYVFQQMVQVLDGVLINDIGLEVFEEFDAASEEEKEELLRVYLTNLGLINQNLQEDIANDPDLKQLSDAIKFMEKVQTGEVQLMGKERVNSGKNARKRKNRKTKHLK